MFIKVNIFYIIKFYFYANVKKLCIQCVMLKNIVLQYPIIK